MAESRSKHCSDKHRSKDRCRKSEDVSHDVTFCKNITVDGTATFNGPIKVNQSADFTRCPSAPGITLKPTETNPCGKNNSLWTNGKCLNFTNNQGQTECLNPEPLVDDPIIGWWTDTLKSSVVSVLQVVNFYYDANRNIRAHYYAGWTNQYREWTPQDFTEFSYYFPSNDIPVKRVENPLGKVKVGYILNYVENPPVDQSLIDYYEYIVTIQDDGTLYANYGDTPREGAGFVNINRYVKIDINTFSKNYPNFILPYNSNIDTTNPVSIFDWSVDFLLYKTAQLNKTINPNDYPGYLKSLAYANQIKNQSVSYNSTISDVWTTRNPIAYFPTNNNQPLTTTFVTTGWHGVKRFGLVYIEGFIGEYDIFNSKNGPWKVSIVENIIPRNLTTVYSSKHFNSSTLKNIFNLPIDSSKVSKYNPNIHGVGKVSVVYGPVTPATEYYELMGAIYEFQTSINLGTHSQTVVYVNNRLPTWKLPDTFDEVKAFLAAGININLGCPTRGRNYIRYGAFYMNCRNGRGTTFGAIPANDPTGMYIGDPKFIFSIDRENYLNKDKTYSIYWGVTGPVKPDVPITGALTAQDPPYKTNGSQFVYRVDNYYAPPPDPSFWSVVAGVKDTYVGGIIDNPQILASMGSKDPIAYIYLQTFNGPDFNLLNLAPYAEFTPKPYPVWYWYGIQMFAPLIIKLKESGAKKYIIDIAGNGGGNSGLGAALLSFFGGDRPGWYQGVTFADNGNKPPLWPPFLLENIKDFGQLYEALNNNIANVLTSTTASLYPDAMIRGDGYQVNIIGSINSFSAADTFYHYAIAGANGRDLGFGVKSKIIGELDGRHEGTAGSQAGLYVNTSHNLLLNNTTPLSGVKFLYECGIVGQRSGPAPYNYYMANQNDLTAPDVLLNGDIDSTIHLDTGYVVPYPLSTKDGGNNPNVLPLSSGKGQPDKNNNKTWRNILLEAALIN
jgi:hypothetical protein